MKPQQSILICVSLSLSLISFIALLSAWTSDLYSITYNDGDTKVLLGENYVHYGAEKLRIYDMFTLQSLSTKKLYEHDVKYKDCSQDWCKDIEDVGSATFDLLVAAWVISFVFMASQFVFLLYKKYQDLLMLTFIPIVSFVLSLAALINWIVKAHNEIEGVLPVVVDGAPYTVYTKYIVIGPSIIMVIVALVSQFLSIITSGLSVTLRNLKANKDTEMESRQ